jgi:hypothetical protein
MVALGEIEEEEDDDAPLIMWRGVVFIFSCH